jgi:thioredoxin 1
VAVELLDFYADWCGPCKVMDPIIDQLTSEWGDKVKLTRINVDIEQEKSTQHNVMSIPTYIVVKDGQEVERLVGAVPKQTLKSKIESNL